MVDLEGPILKSSVPVQVQHDGKSVLSAADVPLCPLCTLKNYPLI